MRRQATRVGRSDGFLRDVVAVGVSAVLVAGAAAASGAAAVAPAAAASGVDDLVVTQTSLPSLRGDVFAQAADLNDRGVVVGTSTGSDSVNHAVIWKRGTVKRLPGTWGVDSAAFGVNGRGHVVGRIGTTAVLWRHGRAVRLPALPGGTRTQAEDVSDRGLIVGTSTTSGTSGAVPVVWWKGKVRALTTLPGRPGGSAQDVNDRGDVVGSLGVAVLWRRGVPEALPMLAGGSGAQARGVNDRKVVVGYSVDPSNQPIPVRWRWGSVKPLPVPEGTVTGIAEDVNRWSTIVGWVLADGRSRPALWWRGQYVELGSGGGPGQAAAMNDHGKAAGWSDGRATVWKIRQTD